YLYLSARVTKQRKVAPTDLVVRLQFYRSFTRFDRFLESPELHQRHPKRVPAIEKIGIQLHAPAVSFDRAVQIADGNVAAGFVKNLLDCLLWHSSSSSFSSSIHSHSEYEDDADNEDDFTSASLPCVSAWLPFLKFQPCCLLAVAQPFDKNNALLVLKNSFLERCLFLPGTRVSERFSLFQNRQESIRTKRHKIGNIARIQQRDRLLDRENLRRLFFLLVAVGFFRFLIDQ